MVTKMLLNNIFSANILYLFFSIGLLLYGIYRLMFLPQKKKYAIFYTLIGGVSLLLTISSSFYTLQNVKNIHSVESDHVIQSQDNIYRSVALDSNSDIDARLGVARYFYRNYGEIILYLDTDNSLKTFVPIEKDHIARKKELDAIELISRLKREVCFRFKLMVIICSVAIGLFILFVFYKRKEEGQV